MLTELVVENLGPIASAEIVLEAGSSALTGETGAGKTLLVTAVTLLAGGRADRGMVRDGASEARVEGRFVVPRDHPVVPLLEARDLADDASDPVEVVMTRTISASGSRARVNGRLVPAGVLGELGPVLVEIAGQHEHLRVTSPRAQREILDLVAGPRAVELAGVVQDDVRELHRVEREIADLEAGERERARELDVLRFEIDEIESASLRPGEIAQLTGDARRLENEEELGAGLTRVVDDLSGDGGADGRLTSALGGLDRMAATDPSLAPFVTRLTEASEELRDVGGELSKLMPEPDPATLASIRDRLGELARLRRKYGDDEDEVIRYLERSRARTEELSSQSARSSDLVAAADRLRTEASAAAEELSRIRAKAGRRLQAEAEKLLDELAMSGAQVVVAIDRTDLYEGGFDAVTIEIGTGPGEKPRPLTKVASGGELSRVALALHLLATDTDGRTMIFDEVDAGVGGAAARTVGAALGRLGRDGAQVLVVTHLPQVAAFADRHYRVRRRDGARRDVVVEQVDGAERVEELSRMLAGLPESDRAREHAQELLDLAASGAER